MRALFLLLLAAAAAVFVLPFVMTSRALDERGVVVRGRVSHKSETVAVSSSTWEVKREITIEYALPNGAGVSFFGVFPDVAQYDAMRTNQPVEVRSLMRRDVPKLPLSDILWQIHALPTVRLGAVSGNSAWHTVWTPAAVRFGKIAAAIAVLLILWRITRSSVLGWAAVIAAVAAFGFILSDQFPRPNPAPSTGVKRATGRVKSIGHIDALFSGRRTRGVIADQPVDVLGVEFIPDGRTEPRGGGGPDRPRVRPGLKEGSTVALRYESDRPRTAWVEGATRTFPKRNFNGAIIQAGLSLAVLLGAFLLWQLFGRRWKNLLADKLG